MQADESCAVVRLPGGERTLAFWMIDRQPIWIETADDGSVTVNGEAVASLQSILHWLRAPPPRGPIVRG